MRKEKVMLRIAGIERESIVDGEGYRFTIFTQGCNHKCYKCQNPSTWDFNAGTVADDKYISDMLNEILNDPVLDGVTLSGGDPFYQAKDLIKICKYLKSKNINIWAYTGFIFEDFLIYKKNIQTLKKDRNASIEINPSSNEINKYMIELLKYIDVLVDGPFIEEKKSLEVHYRGSTNQRLIDVKKSLRREKVVIYQLQDE